jgi:plasmid maintenance system antidote protein VapI
MIQDRMRPVHPGEILEENILKPLKATGLTR